MMLNLKEMTTEEKLLTMELLWDDLSHKNEDFESPEWHKDILKERSRKLKSGESKLIEWNEAKRRLREKF